MGKDNVQENQEGPNLETSIEDLLKLQTPTTREGLQDKLIKTHDVTDNPFVTKDTRVGFIKNPQEWLKNNKHLEMAGELWREGFYDVAFTIADVAHISFITSGSLGGAQQNAIISERTEFTSNNFESKKPNSTNPISQLKEKWTW